MNDDNNNKNNNKNIVEFPYGKYPTNLLKLFEKSYENRKGKERKLLYCIAWCKDLTPKTKPQILMDICVESYKTRGKFLHEMDKDEAKKTLDELLESKFLFDR
jgi:hypothetical protein